MAQMEIEIDHSVKPPTPPPAEKEEPEIPEKLLKVMKKYKYNWRLDMLSKPVRRYPKYQKKPDEYESTVAPDVLTAKCSKRCDHLSRPGLRMLHYNKRNYKFLGKKYEKKIDASIKSSWASMYNYYRKSEMDLAKRRRSRSRGSRTSTKSSKSKQSRSSFKSEKERQEWINNISAPKKTPPPAPLPPRKRESLSKLLVRIDEISTPKPSYGYLPPREVPIPIKKSALEYEMSEQMASLASKIPERFKTKPAPPPPLGSVKKSALTYKATPNIEKLAEHKVVPAGRESDIKEDAFVISPNALKYKATPRIQELAKPVDRK